eukprot:12927000-Prorocentrum_lima.AAC.1
MAPFLQDQGAREGVAPSARKVGKENVGHAHLQGHHRSTREAQNTRGGSKGRPRQKAQKAFTMTA